MLVQAIKQGGSYTLSKHIVGRPSPEVGQQPGTPLTVCLSLLPLTIATCCCRFVARAPPQAQRSLKQPSLTAYPTANLRPCREHSNRALTAMLTSTGRGWRWCLWLCLFPARAQHPGTCRMTAARVPMLVSMSTACFEEGPKQATRMGHVEKGKESATDSLSAYCKLSYASTERAHAILVGGLLGQYLCRG
jgi:hypothetical protein